MVVRWVGRLEDMDGPRRPGSIGQGRLARACPAWCEKPLAAVTARREASAGQSGEAPGCSSGSQLESGRMHMHNPPTELAASIIIHTNYDRPQWAPRRSA
jgi:hypothetical protein